MDVIDLKEKNTLAGRAHTVKNLFATIIDAQAYLADTPAELLPLMRKKKQEIKPREEGIVHLLHNSLIPAPATAYDGIYVLGAGDYLTFDKRNLSAPPSYKCDFPYVESKSSGRSLASSDTLFELLCQAVAKHGTNTPTALMISSGKDSTAIALAMRECGMQDVVQAYTYGDDHEEAELAVIACKKIGLKHKVILMPEAPGKIKEAMLNFFTHASHPCCDPAVIPSAVIMYHESIRNMNVMEGSNNSIFMGFIPSKKYEMIDKYYRILGGGYPSFTKSLRQMVPYYAKWYKMLTTGTEPSLLYKHSHLRDRETRKFYPHTYDTEKFWKAWFRQNIPVPEGESVAVLMGQNFCSTSSMFKGQMSTEQVGSRQILPWLDEDIVDYFFNLPTREKYNPDTKRTKLLLHEIMKKHMGDDFNKIGKKIFFFDTQQFVINNRSFIFDEILSCKLWERGIEKELNRYYGYALKKPRAATAIVDLFLISGWHNHCKYLKET